jgi:hypothetical protein
MKKFLLSCCTLFIAGLTMAQETIVASKYPVPSSSVFFVDDQQRTIDVPGADKMKLFAVLKTWFNDKFKVADTVGDVMSLNGVGIFYGSYTYHGDSPEKSNVAPVNYSITYSIRIDVSNQKYVVYLSKFQVITTSVTGQSPQLSGYTNTRPAVSNGPFKTDPEELTSNIREYISLSVHALFKNATKYISKAQKKGLL